MRSRFDEQLSTLNEELTRMGALCEEVISLADRALGEGDAEAAKKVAPIDAEIDRMEHTIESLCLRLLLQQQPVARDLRQSLRREIFASRSANKSEQSFIRASGEVATSQSFSLVR